MAGLDPLTAREGLRTAREVISGRQVSYPVLYLAIVLGCLVVACLIVANFATGTVRVVDWGVAVTMAVALVVMLIYAIGFRRDLLRSERHELITRLIDIAGDKETAPAFRDRISNTIIALSEPKKHVRDLRDEDDGDAG